MSTIASDDRGLILACPQCSQLNRLPYDHLNRLPRCRKCGSDLPVVGEPVDVESDGNFDALTSRSALPVLVDFWAAWCGPCKMIAPEVAKVAAQGAGRWLVAKVNTEMLPAVARRFAVSSIPLLILFNNGHEVARQAGALPAPSIRQFIERHS